MPRFQEFFAGAGMVRAGLGESWECVFANDFDAKKATTYRRNWSAPNRPDAHLHVGDIRDVDAADLPAADLAWASFPCQDLSLAGGGAGLKGERSGTFFPFWRLMTQLKDRGEAPTIIALENVVGTLTSHGGRDFAAIVDQFVSGDYRVGALVVDAVEFVPQSRPRLFVIGVRSGVPIPTELEQCEPTGPYHSASLRRAFERLDEHLQSQWVWWSLPTPTVKPKPLSDVIDREGPDLDWHTPAETDRLVGMMNQVHLEKLAEARKLKRRVVGTIYRRTRRENGQKVQRAEVRFDGVAGCLRTPSGGSSRQLIIEVDGDSVRSRLISARETARLMGLPESYELPDRYNDAYHLTGDGVAVPAVTHLREHLFEPILGAVSRSESSAA